MNILITGATGFVGTAFLKYIDRNRLYYNDRIVLLSSKIIPGYDCILHNGYTFVQDEFQRLKIDSFDIVYHLGAATPKTKELVDEETIYKYATNFINTKYLLDNLPGGVPKVFVFISTVSVYQNVSIISEKTPYQTNDLYGVSKLFCEAYLRKEAERKNFELKILRLGQIYGEGEETYSKIVSSFVKQILTNKPITVFGDGSALRSLLNCDDCCKCIWASSLNSFPSGEAINIASGNPIKISDLVKLCYKCCGVKENVQYKTDKVAGSIIYDVSKLYKYINFSEMTYEQGVSRYVNYYKTKILGVQR
jgi:UDP-glucuronate 4-epimerase